MDLAVAAVPVLLGGGLFALTGRLMFSLMKKGTVILLALGCLMGLGGAFRALWQPKALQFSLTYLNQFQLAFRIDTLSAFFLIAIFAISLLAVIYSYHYMTDNKRQSAIAVHYFFFSLLIASMALVVTADNMVSFMMSWEVMSLSSFFLVMYDYHQPENRKAGLIYIVFSHAGTMFILIAFGLVYAHTGSFSFQGFGTLPNPIKLMVFVSAFIGFGSKAGIFPFHMWLPHAHPAAPSHISAVMSGVMIKTGIYGIMRIYSLLEYHPVAPGVIVLTAGIISGILGVVYALGQHDMKRLLAYHSVENIGIILIGMGVGMIGVSFNHPVMAVFGFAGGLLHVLNHSIFKSLLFMGAGMVLHQTGTRTIDLLGGLLKSMKITGTTFLIGSLAISGLPPLNGFVSELLIYLGAFNGVSFDHTVLIAGASAIIGLAIIGGLALACFTKVVGVVFQGEPRSRCAADKTEHGTTMLISMGVLACFCIIIGILPGLFVKMAVQGLSAMSLGYGRIPVEPFVHLTGNVTLAVLIFMGVLGAVICIRHLAYAKKPIGSKGTWGCGFTQPTPKMQYTGSSYAASVLELFETVAPCDVHLSPIRGRFPEKATFHSQVNDITEQYLPVVIIRPIRWIFDRLRWIQQGNIHLYIGYIFLTIVVLLFFI